MVKKFFSFVVPAVALTAVLLMAGGAVGGGQHVEKAGNCLSFPVIFGEGSVPLRDNDGGPMPIFEGVSTESVEGYTVWVQQDLKNIWQAAAATSWGSESPYVTWVDWGDNLESQDWRTTSKVRVETVLSKVELVTPMTGYEMYFVSGLGKDEVWGTNQSTYPGYEATVYSDHARLTIQKIDPAATLIWNSTLGEWEGAGVTTVFSGGCWEAGDGPGGYSAEVNVKGKVIYGFNWDVRNLGNIPADQKAGVYRITFSLDPNHGTDPLTTSLAFAQILPPSEGEETAITLAAAGAGGGRKPGGGGGGGDSTGGGGTAYIDAANNLTYIDVTIKAGGGGRR